MVDALNRLDQTDALVEYILGDRAKLEHHANRGHAHPNIHAQACPLEAETTTSSESNHYLTTKQLRTQKVISWIGIPKELMMTVIPWWMKTGLLWYPYHGKDLWKRKKRVR